MVAMGECDLRVEHYLRSFPFSISIWIVASIAVCSIDC